MRQTGVGLQGLLRGADRVAKGDLNQPIPITTKDELAQLASTFNQMMSDLASREQRLQARLSELEALRRVSLQLTSTLNPVRVMNTIVRSALDLVRAAEVHIFLCDETGTNPQFGASANGHLHLRYILRGDYPDSMDWSLNVLKRANSK